MSLPTYTLQRIRQTSSATFGEMRDASAKRLAYSLERPWLDNQRGVSCIPAGTYRVMRRWSPKHGRMVYGLLDVPGRSDIEIHSANDARELEGCIALGTGLGEVDTPKYGRSYGILDSRAAVQAFEAIVGVDEWMLIVKDLPTGPTP